LKSLAPENGLAALLASNKLRRQRLAEVEPVISACR
jgi:hypothetical protein